VKDSESAPEPTLPTHRRLVLLDRGVLMFLLNWHSFLFRVGHQPPRKAMGLFGLSAELRSLLEENAQTALLAKRFDARARTLMAFCFLPGGLYIVTFMVLSLLPGHLTGVLQEHYPSFAAVLALALILVAILARGLYRSFTSLFDAYNASNETDLPNQSE